MIFDEPIECRLETVSLDRPPHHYWALSYSWDAQTPSEPITVLPSWCDDSSDYPQGGVLKVTANCVAAMRRLRASGQPLTLWIDSICIDQTSLEESSNQVDLMSEIFRAAGRVVVWLGEEDGPARRAMSLLRRIGDFDNDGIGSVDKGKRQRQTRFHARARALLKEDGCTSAETDKLGAIFRRSWFTRMWTIQEVVFPLGERVHVRCGRTMILWLRLVAAANCLEAINYPWGGWREAMRVQNYLTQMVHLRRSPQLRQLVEGNPGDRVSEFYASAVMVRCREKAASDPKDKAIALYGLLDELGVRLPRPDYAKSIADIYTETTAACIEHDKILLVLYHAPPDTRRPGLPLWVPDWSDRGWHEDDARYAKWRDRFAASGGSYPMWKFGPDRRRLTVYGKIIDTVTYRAASYTTASPPDLSGLVTRDGSGRLTVSDELRGVHAMYRALKAWVELSDRAERYPTGETVADVLRRTLVNDDPEVVGLDDTHGYSGDWLAAMRAGEEDLAAQATTSLTMPSLSTRSGSGGDGGLFARLTAWVVSALESQPAAVEQTSLGLVDGEDMPTELRTLLALMGRRKAWQFHSYVIPFSSKKSFFRTSNGFLGTAPDQTAEAMQPGDPIAVVAGLELPVVLRPDGEGGYRLVSHCYVHGIMHGEAWERVGDHLDKIVLV
ncbi:hypothetical protein VTH06DRAFT_4560 [Thermothelomyces fergusii]